MIKLKSLVELIRKFLRNLGISIRTNQKLQFLNIRVLHSHGGKNFIHHLSRLFIQIRKDGLLPDLISLLIHLQLIPLK